MENATIKYTARFEDLNSDTVTVKYQNRKKYEFYKKKVAVFRMTGTWCVACPSMATAMKQMKTTMPDNFIEIALHASTSSSTDPYHTDRTAEFATAMGGLSAFPTAVYNLRKSTASSNSSTSVIRTYIENEMIQDPAICAIKVNTTYDSSTRVVKINSGIITDKGGDFELAYGILIDGLISAQEGANESYVHDNTLLAFTGNFLGSNDKISLSAGEEHEYATFDVTLAEGLDSSKIRVIVYAITNNNGENIINNIV